MTGALDLDSYAGHLIRRAEQVHTALWNRFVSDTVTSQQFAVLNALRAHPGVDQRTVAGLVSLDRSTAHLIVTRLTERGYVGQERDEDDRRRTLLTLTAAGRTLHASLVTAAEKINAELLAAFPAQERPGALRVLGRLARLEPKEAAEPS
ncbi:MarR family winged helix-turn-helix transcriptional regulator [Streptomyces hydrogenans]